MSTIICWFHMLIQRHCHVHWILKGWLVVYFNAKLISFRNIKPSLSYRRCCQIMCMILKTHWLNQRLLCFHFVFFYSFYKLLKQVITYIYIYIYVWKLNQTVLELDFRAVKFLFFPRRDLNPHHCYTAAPFA